MSPQKYIASTLVAVFFFSSLFPGQLLAAPKQSGKSIINISSNVRSKMGKQQEYLRTLGNPKEYQKADIQWDTQKQKPSHIRGISKKASKNIVADTKQILKDFAPSYGVSAGIAMDIRLAKNDTSKLTKERHTRLEQYYNNLEIVGGEILAHTDENGILYQVDGTLDAPNISIVPSITKTQALSAGMKEHGTKKKFEITRQPELVLYKRASNYILAYRYGVSYDDPTARMGQWIYYVDAQTGKKITAYNLVHDIETPVSLSGSLLAGEGGSMKTFTGTFDTSNNTYYMYNLFSASGAYSIFNASTNTGTYVDAFNYANRTTSNWGTSDRVEVSAAYNMAKTLEYYNALGFGVNNITFSLTGQTDLPVFVHYGAGYNNAFWSSGDGMYFGDGDGINLKPLATLDVMAHEFGHAWTENTSNLIYQDEPGALNESFSDISGVNVEMYVQTASNNYPDVTPGQADWLIGEDVMIGEKALRDMRNPANTTTVGTGNEQPTRYKGTYWYFGSGDYGGVHYNNSVQNFFYYLLSEGGSGNNDGVLYSVDGIGLENARRIAFETNTHFLTSTATYKDARQAWIDAANSINPSFVPSVEAAWDAVDVAADPVLSLATAEESFENGTNLPTGYTSSLLSGSGGPWSVTTSTGALGSNSLVSGVIGNSSTTAVSWSGVTDAGYTTFYWRTSSEAVYDTLDFYIDGVQRASWSGINPWSFYSDAITSGSHTFTWEYNKDSSLSEGLDQVGIDAVHTIAFTGSVSVTSDTATGQYVSPVGLQAQIDVAGAYDYIISRSDGQMTRGSATDGMSLSLTGLPEGSGSIDFQYRDSNGFLSPILTQSFFLDSVAPTITSIISPTDGTYYNTGTISLSWDAVTDTGAGLQTNPYVYMIATDSGFVNIVAGDMSDQPSVTGINLADGTYFAKIQSRDTVGNYSTSPVVSFTVDTISPPEPTNISVNGGNIINVDTQSNVIVTGSGGVSESGSIMNYTIFDSASGSVTGTGLIDSNGSFLFSYIDVSSLADGTLSCNFYITDQAGNSGNSIVVTIGKSVILAAGSISFPSGAYVNTGATNVQISVAKPVSYVISGSGITESITGTLASAGTIIVPVTLSPTNGIKNIQATFTDSVGVETTSSASIILDIPNIIDISLPSSDVYMTGSVMFSGVLATGSTVFSGTETVSITDAVNSTDRVSLSFSGLIITTTGTGVWDGVMLPPRSVSLSGITLSGNGYAHTGAVFKAGNDSIGLSLSGQTASLQVYLGTSFNDRILRVYRSDTGEVFDPIDVCTVSLGICQFATNHFSFFAFGTPNPITNPAPVLSSGGGGGGGGSIVRVDSCPNGDTSLSYYDGICEKVSTQNVSTSSSITPQKTSVARSGFLSNNQVVAEYDFTANKRIPQKVAAELNFFITKLTKILDAKSKGNEAKKQKYYQAVNIYIANRAQQASDTREKRIMEYLGTRLVVVGRGIITQQVVTKIIHKNIPSKTH